LGGEEDEESAADAKLVYRGSPVGEGNVGDTNADESAQDEERRKASNEYGSVPHLCAAPRGDRI
jgi:hypothetical protein